MDWEQQHIDDLLWRERLVLQRNIATDTGEEIPLEHLHTYGLRLNEDQERLHCLIVGVPRIWEPEELWTPTAFAVHEGRLYAYVNEWDHLEPEQWEGLLAKLGLTLTLLGEPVLVEQWHDDPEDDVEGGGA